MVEVLTLFSANSVLVFQEVLILKCVFLVCFPGSKYVVSKPELLFAYTLKVLALIQSVF